MTIRRVMPHVRSDRFDESRAFYIGFLGFEEAMTMDRMLMLGSPDVHAAQLSIVAPDPSSPHQPQITVEVGDVDEAHAAAVEHGVRVVYPLTDEPWGVRRFFVLDPQDVVINVMSHR